MEPNETKAMHPMRRERLRALGAHAITLAVGGFVTGVSLSLVLMRWWWGVNALRVLMLAALVAQLATLYWWKAHLAKQKGEMRNAVRSMVEFLHPGLSPIEKEEYADAMMKDIAP